MWSRMSRPVRRGSRTTLAPFLLLTLSLLCVRVQGAEKSTCDLSSVTAKKDFDLKKFVGKWSTTEVVSKDSANEVKVYKCDSTIYTPISATSINTTVVYRNGTTTPPKKEVTIETLLIGNLDQPAVWTMKGEFTLNYVVLDTDYDTYGIIYTCVDTVPPHESYFSHIRAQTPSDEVKRTTSAALTSALPKDFDKEPKTLVRSTAIQSDCDKN